MFFDLTKTMRAPKEEADQKEPTLESSIKKFTKSTMNPSPSSEDGAAYDDAGLPTVRGIGAVMRQQRQNLAQAIKDPSKESDYNPFAGVGRAIKGYVAEQAKKEKQDSDKNQEMMNSSENMDNIKAAKDSDLAKSKKPRYERIRKLTKTDWA
jgi:hypothetical protein